MPVRQGLQLGRLWLARSALGLPAQPGDACMVAARSRAYTVVASARPCPPGSGSNTRARTGGGGCGSPARLPDSGGELARL